MVVERNRPQSIDDRLTVGKSNEPRWEDQLSTLRVVSERDGWGTDPIAGQAVEESVATTLLQSTQAHSG